jgi:hypothetical protein
MLEKPLAQYTPEDLTLTIEDHLDNTPGFVGKDPHPVFSFLQEEQDREKLLRFFHGFASEDAYISYCALPVLSDLSGKILRDGLKAQSGVIDPAIFIQASSVVHNLSEEIIDPAEGKPHTALWEDLRRDTAMLLEIPVESDELIHYSLSPETLEATSMMNMAINNSVSGLLSLAHAEHWMVRENGIMLPAGERAGISAKGLAAIKANMNADIGHGSASVEAAIKLARYLPIGSAEIREVFEKSNAWRMKFYDQWERWVYGA